MKCYIYKIENNTDKDQFYIGSTLNSMSGCRIGDSQFGRKMQEITNKIESGADFVANNEDKAQGLVNDISRKINA